MRGGAALAQQIRWKRTTFLQHNICEIVIVSCSLITNFLKDYNDFLGGWSLVNLISNDYEYENLLKPQCLKQSSL